MFLMSESDDELERVGEQACNYFYDHAALAAMFRSGRYDMQHVRDELTGHQQTLDAVLGQGVHILSTVPGLEGFDVDIRGAVELVLEDIETLYAEREPYAIAAGVYINLLERFGGHEAVVLLQVDEAIEHYTEVLAGKADDNGAIEALKQRAGISVEMYLAGLKKIKDELPVLIQILEKCRSTIPQVNMWLVQREELIRRSHSEIPS
jgi:hypothetical protein